MCINKFCIPVLRKHFEIYYSYLNWYYMCSKKDNETINFIKENIDFLSNGCWIILVKNDNYNARLIVQNNYDKFKKNNDFWEALQYIENETSLYLFETYKTKINWTKLSSNPIIFDLDYKHLKESKKNINREIMRKYYMLDKQKYINYYNCNIILSYM